MYGVNSMGVYWVYGVHSDGNTCCIVWSVCGTRYHLIFMRTHIMCIVFGAYIRSDVKRAHIGYIVNVLGTYAANTMHLIYGIHCIGSMYQEHYVGSAYWVHYVGSTYWVHYVWSTYWVHYVGNTYWVHYVGSTYWVHYVGSTYWVHYVGSTY